MVLFSRAPSPSLTYHLTALSLHETLDFAYSPVGRVEVEGGLGGKFGVKAGERKLMVFKESSSPVLVEKVLQSSYNTCLNLVFQISELSRDLLLSLVEGVTLYLPRLSSPAMFDIACPLTQNRYHFK